MRRHGHLLRSAYLVADALAALTAAALAYVVRFETGWIEIVGRTDVLPGRYLAALPVTVAIVLLSASLMGGYDDRELQRPAPVRRALRVAALAGALLAATALLYRDVFQYSRLAIVFAGVAFLPCFVAGRVLAARLVTRLRRRSSSRAVVIGGGRPAHALADALARHPWAGEPVRAVLALGPVPEPWAHAEILESLDDVLTEVAEGRVVEVYLAVPASRAAEVPEILTRLEQTPVDVRVVPDLGPSVPVNPDASVLSGVPIVSLRERPLYGARAGAKRALDIALAALLLALLSPALVLIAVLVRLTSPGPALYAQERMGLDGTPFRMWKFRSMRVDAEEGSGPVLATAGDARVTALGRVLRRFSLDELPQLWNVLRGDMSLVGPRPERRAFVEKFRNSFAGYMLRLSVRAGMTGWAQVHGLRGDSSMEERLRYDLEYIDRWSLLLDLEILCRTLSQVLRGENAH